MSITAIIIDTNTSVVGQKGESENGCYKKTKHAIFSEKRIFLNPRYAQAMFTLYRIAFHAVSGSYTVQCEQMFFAVMVSMISKIFNVKRVS